MPASFYETWKRLQRMPRHQRIAFLKDRIALEKPRSVRAVELGIALKREVTAQLRSENRAV